MHLSHACFALVGFLAVQTLGAPLFEHAVQDLSSPKMAKRPAPPTHIRHEWTEPRHEEGWKLKARADPMAVLPMRIGLKQSNLEKGHDLLMEISNPKSPRFSKHLTFDEVNDLFAPSTTSVEAVKGWLAKAGISPKRISQSANKQWIQFDARVEEVERLLYASYYLYEHTDTGALTLACPEYHVPLKVRHHIDYITPGVRLASYGLEELVFRRARRKQRRKIQSDIAASRPVPAVQGGCERTVTPECIKNQYQIPTITTATAGNELGIFQSLSQHYLQEDLDVYFSTMAPQVPNGTAPELRSINGAFGPASVTNVAAIGEEADLDLEIAIPLIYPQKTVLWQTDDEWYEQDMQKSSTQYNGFFNTLFDAIDGSYCSFNAYDQGGNCEEPACKDPVYPNPQDPDGYQGELMCGAYEPTNVIAISYSGVESVLPYAYMQRQCVEVLKLGLRGVTVVESSGDNGVGGGRFDRREGCLGPDRAVFSPRTMSNCPYVLSVGATMLVANASSSVHIHKATSNRLEQQQQQQPPQEKQKRSYGEIATTFFPSGGGFSNVFKTPSWQEDAVARYLSAANLSFEGYEGGGSNYSRVGAEPGRLFNKAGRGYPDVAAVGDNFMVMYRGYFDKIAGTSISVPIWASILTLINEARLAANKSTVGFVNPVLYDHPEVFNDITVGRNPGCGTEGFHAREGWDPVTGLGTPVYPKLLDLFMSLP